MKEMEILRTLANGARQEPVPEVDAVAGVLEALRTHEDDARNPLAWVVGIASVAAIPATVLGLLALESITNPLLGVYWVLRWTI